MSISEEDILKELDRIQHDFEESKVNVKCLETRNEFDIGGKKVKLNKGSTIQVPFWLATILEEEKLVKIEFSLKIDVPYLYRLSDNEKRDERLQQINPFFYIIASKVFNEYKEKKALSSREYEYMNRMLREIMTKRLSKIIRIAEKGKNITSTSKNMSAEEKWLYNIVADAIEKWKSMIKNGD